MAFFLWLLLVCTLIGDGLTQGQIRCQDVLSNQDGRSIEVHICRGERLNLTEIPGQFPANVTRIHLPRNSIKAIPRNAFRSSPQLEVLDLSHNQIESVDPYAFNGTKLKDLYLQNNAINFSRQNLVASAFYNLDQLAILDISFNKMWRTSPLQEHPYIPSCSIPVYRGDLFGQLMNLESLTMDSLPYGSPFPPEFSYLSKLSTLILRAKMTNILNETFAAFSLSPIQSLTIWSGYLGPMDTMSFAHFPRLERLDLSYNIFLGFDKMSSAWPGLAFTRIQELVLVWVDRFESGIVKLEESFFYGLQHTRIRKLILDGNNINTVEGLFGCYLPHLEYLSLNRNRLIQVVSVTETLGQLKNLTFLDTSFQSQRTFITEEELLTFGQDDDTDTNSCPPLFSTSLVSMATVGARLNEMTPLSYAFTNSTGQPRVDLQGTLPIARTDRLNCPEAIEPSPLDLLKDIHFNLPPALEVLNLSASLSIELFGFFDAVVYVHNGTSLKVFDYSLNGVRNFDFNLNFTSPSIHNVLVNLSHNGCFSVGRSFLGQFGHIGELYLQNNKLGVYLSDDAMTWDNNYSDVTIVDLSDNVIKSLPVTSFSGMHQLKDLNLARNALREIRGHVFDNNPSLQRVDLSTNVLPSLSEELTEALEEHVKKLKAQNKSLSINLAENPLECHCDTLEFLQWTYKHAVDRSSGIDLIDYENYSCWYRGEIIVWDEGSLSNTITTLKVECTWRFWAIIGGVCFAFLLLVIACSICVRRHKWDIRFYILNFIARRTEKRRGKNGGIPNRESRSVYDYDAYVSYDGSDLPWVKHKLLRHLENPDVGLRCCLSDRDFTPGAPIEDNIVSHMRKSRKVLLVISNASLANNWRHLEMELARIKSLDEGRNVIVPVLLDPLHGLNRDRMSSILISALQKGNFLEWSRDPELQAQFWNALIRELECNARPRLHCECGRVFFKRGPRFNALPRFV